MRRQFLHAVGTGLAVGALTLAIAAVAVAVVIPRAAGFVPLTIQTPSMGEHLVGALAVARPVSSPMDLRVGEIAVYQASAGTSSTITHRIVERVLDGRGGVSYRFQGDANLLPDRDIIVPGRVVGKVVYVVPWLGFVAAFANTLAGKITLAGAGLAAIAAAVTRSALKRRGEGVELVG